MSEEVGQQDENKAKQRDTIDKINQDILKLEQKANELIDGVDIGELAALDRCELYVKFINQKTRLFILKHSFDLEMPVTRESTLMIAFQKHLRGERLEEIDG